jgi:aconitate hydratase
MEQEKMIDLSSTPEFVAGVYETMKTSLPGVRRRLGRPLTLTDNILLSHLDKPEEQEMIPGTSYLHVRPDRVILQDALGQFAMLQFMQTGKERVALPTTMHCDHLTKARLRGDLDLSASNRENKEIYDFLKSAAARYGIGFWAPGAGIMHQLILRGYESGSGSNGAETGAAAYLHSET